MIFDTHAHYDDAAFDEDREEIFARFPHAGIGMVCDVASTIPSIDAVLDIAHSHDFIVAAIGVHPSECEPMTGEQLDRIRDLCADPKVVAIGEIGLDYHWDTPERDLQKEWFEKQILLAQEVKKPIIVHSRDAAQDTMEIMKKCRAGRTGGVIHCFSYSLEMAREFIRMGFFIGIGGVVTFKNARKVKEVVAGIPLEKIVLETDCPYMAPTPHRGERNSSLYLPIVARQIAELKGTTADEVIEQTWKNAHLLYMMNETGENL